MEEARKLGLVTGDQVRVADEYQAATLRMNEAISALTREFATRLAPAVTVVANAITELLRLLPDMPRSISDTADAAERLTRQIEVQERVVKSAQDAIDDLIRRYGERARSTEAYRLAVERLAATEARLLALRTELNSANEVIPIAPRSAPAPDPAALRLAAQEAIAEANFQLQQLQERLNGSRTILDEMNFAWMSHAEIVAAASEHINQAYQRQGDQRRALASLEQMLNKKQQEQMLQTASLAAQVITQLFPKSKGAAIAAAVINTAVGITKALSELLPPWSWIQAGLIAASGAAQIATIRSTTQTGGGATPSPGGGGAGEQPTGETAAPGRALSIQGIDPAAIFSGRQLEGLIANINDEVNNGVTLITTRNIPT
jgi:hypothetical protein